MLEKDLSSPHYPRKGQVLPRLTYALIGINSLIWILQVFFDQVTLAAVHNPLYVEYSGQWYRLITAGFIHSPTGVTHLLLNMLTLYLFGQALEPLLGPKKFITIYLVSILGGSLAVQGLAHLLGTMNVNTLGASGGVFGLFGAYFALARARRKSTQGILILVGINFAFGLLEPSISWEAHLGGLLTGLVFTWLLEGKRLQRRPR